MDKLPIQGPVKGPAKNTKDNVQVVAENGTKGLSSFPRDPFWEDFSRSVSRENLPELEGKILAGSFSAKDVEKLFPEGLKAHWREGFFLLGLRERSSLSPQALLSLVEKMPDDMLKNIFSQINGKEFNLFDKKIGTIKKDEKKRVEDIGERITNLLAPQPESQKTEELEETQEPIEIDIGDEYVEKDIPMMEKTLFSNKVPTAEAKDTTPRENMTTDEENQVREWETITPEAGNETIEQKIVLPKGENETITLEETISPIEEKIPEIRELRKVLNLMSEITGRGYDIHPVALEKQNYEKNCTVEKLSKIRTDLEALKKIIKDVKDEYLGKTITTLEIMPTIIISTAIEDSGYKLIPLGKDFPKTENGLEFSSIEEAFSKIQRSDEEIAKEKQKTDKEKKEEQRRREISMKIEIMKWIDIKNRFIEYLEGKEK